MRRGGTLEATDCSICVISGISGPEGQTDKAEDFYLRIALCADLQIPP